MLRFIMLYKVVLTFERVFEILNSGSQMKAIEYYVPVYYAITGGSSAYVFEFNSVAGTFKTLKVQ